MEISQVRIGNVLTRTRGYLTGVTSHSLQPYRGCSLGNSLCGVGCYVQHNRHLTRGRPWGGFLEVRTNAAESYARHYPRERSWARKRRTRFSIFMSSATDPFVPQESQFGISAAILESMLRLPPDELILQTHSHRVEDRLFLIADLAQHTRIRVQISIETDRQRIPGLPPAASSVAARLEAARTFRKAGLNTVIAVAPLLPLEDPKEFLTRISTAADAVIIDHYIGGDGTDTGWKTRNTPLPEAIASLEPSANTLDYRDSIVALARRIMPGRVGVGRSGFAGKYS